MTVNISRLFAIFTASVAAMYVVELVKDAIVQSWGWVLFDSLALVLLILCYWNDWFNLWRWLHRHEEDE